MPLGAEPSPPGAPHAPPGGNLLIEGVTVIDAVSDSPLEGASVLVLQGRVRDVAEGKRIAAPIGCETIDGRGKFLIPGLLNADVHLFCDYRLESLVAHDDKYEDVILEAAQIALAAGLTTVFDTWGPRASLQQVRARIDRAEVEGSRIYCAGNIIGFDGPISKDFSAKALELASSSFTHRVNARWAENVGRHLLWLTPEGVAREVEGYLKRGVDFVEYASNGHGGAFESSSLALSPGSQRAIVDVAHSHGLTAQAHTTSVEGLRHAVTAGCSLVVHANMTGPTEIPDDLIELIVERDVGMIVFPFTRARWSQLLETASSEDLTIWEASDRNVEKLLAAGARLLLGNDGYVASSDMLAEPAFNRAHLAPGPDNLFDLQLGHLAWLRAMAEKGMRPMELLRAATLNVAHAYRKRDLGAIEIGRWGDLVLLDADPLQSVENYGRINKVIKEGRVVDRAALPRNPVLTRRGAARSAVLEQHVPFLRSAKS